MIMKLNFLKWMVCMCFGLLSVATVMAGGYAGGKYRVRLRAS